MCVFVPSHIKSRHLLICGGTFVCNRAKGGFTNEKKVINKAEPNKIIFANQLKKNPTIIIKANITVYALANISSFSTFSSGTAPKFLES